MINTFVEHASTKIGQISGHWLIMTVFMFILLYASYTDAMEMKIKNNFNLFALFARIVITPIFPLNIFDIMGGVGLFIAFLIVGMINIKNDMAGDIKFAGVFGLWTGMYLGSLCMILGILIMIPISLYKKSSQPMAPFTSIATCLIFLAKSFGFI